jgi:hypothetical protein
VCVVKRTHSPPLIPGFDFEVCVVLDDFGPAGRAYREADEDKADRETVIRNIMRGEYERPLRVVAFNTAEGWSRDITEDIGREIVERAHRAGETLSGSAAAFVEWSTGENVPANLMDGWFAGS